MFWDCALRLIYIGNYYHHQTKDGACHPPPPPTPPAEFLGDFHRKILTWQFRREVSSHDHFGRWKRHLHLTMVIKRSRIESSLNRVFCVVRSTPLFVGCFSFKKMQICWILELHVFNFQPAGKQQPGGNLTGRTSVLEASSGMPMSAGPNKNTQGLDWVGRWVVELLMIDFLEPRAAPWDWSSFYLHLSWIYGKCR